MTKISFDGKFSFRGGGFKMTHFPLRITIFDKHLNAPIRPKMQRNFFTLVTPPPSKAWTLCRFSTMYFQLFKVKIIFFFTKVRQIKGGGVALFMETFHQKIFLSSMPPPKCHRTRGWEGVSLIKRSYSLKASMSSYL